MCWLWCDGSSWILIDKDLTASNCFSSRVSSCSAVRRRKRGDSLPRTLLSLTHLWRPQDCIYNAGLWAGGHTRGKSLQRPFQRSDNARRSTNHFHYLCGGAADGLSASQINLITQLSTQRCCLPRGRKKPLESFCTDCWRQVAVIEVGSRNSKLCQTYLFNF